MLHLITVVDIFPLMYNPPFLSLMPFEGGKGDFLASITSSQVLSSLSFAISRVYFGGKSTPTHCSGIHYVLYF